jgi:hypothetical protein
MQHVPARRRTNVEKPKKLGQKITLDHVYVCARSEQMEGLGCDRDMLVIYDLATGWLHNEPVKNKKAALTIEGLNKFKGADAHIKSVYSDKSNEIAKAVRKVCRHRPIPHDTSVPGMPSRNTIAENQVKLAIRGIRLLLAQAGLPVCFLPLAARCFSFLRNMVIRGGDSAYNKRHGKGHLDQNKLLPFGCFVEFMPSPVAKKCKQRKLCSPGIVVGYKLMAGGLWDKAYECIALEDFAGKDFHRHTPIHKFDAPSTLYAS